MKWLVSGKEKSTELRRMGWRGTLGEQWTFLLRESRGSCKSILLTSWMSNRKGCLRGSAVVRGCLKHVVVRIKIGKDDVGEENG